MSLVPGTVLGSWVMLRNYLLNGIILKAVGRTERSALVLYLDRITFRVCCRSMAFHAACALSGGNGEKIRFEL